MQESRSDTCGVTWGELDAQQMLIAGASYVLSDEEDLALCMDFL